MKINKWKVRKQRAVRGARKVLEVSSFVADIGLTIRNLRNEPHWYDYAAAAISIGQKINEKHNSSRSVGDLYRVYIESLEGDWRPLSFGKIDKKILPNAESFDSYKNLTFYRAKFKEGTIVWGETSNGEPRRPYFQGDEQVILDDLSNLFWDNDLLLYYNMIFPIRRSDEKAKISWQAAVINDLNQQQGFSETELRKRLSREINQRLACGYKHSVMLHGPPGTGKTTTAIQLAQDYSRPVLLKPFIFNDSGHGPNQPFCNFSILHAIKPDFIFLDDVDRLIEHYRERLHLRLDEFASIAKTVVITTNHPEKLTEATLSRIDETIFVNTADPTLISFIFGKVHPLPKDRISRLPARYLKRIKKDLDSLGPEKALQTLTDMERRFKQPKKVVKVENEEGVGYGEKIPIDEPESVGYKDEPKSAC